MIKEFKTTNLRIKNVCNKPIDQFICFNLIKYITLSDRKLDK